MKKNTLIFLLITLVIIFAFFYPTLFFKVKIFDEITPFKETYLPVPLSFSEIFELISLLGLNQHFEATNTLYSNIVSLRNNPLGNLVQLFVQFFCKKSPVAYHTYSLFFHLINSVLVFFILNSVSKFFLKDKENLRLTFISLLTFFWAIHPVNLEAVLLLTNGNVIFSYSLCFLVFLLYMDLKNMSLLKSIFIFLIFTFALFIVEYHITIPVILAFYLACISNTNNSFKLTKPLLFSLFVFLLFFIFSSTKVNLSSNLSPQLILERIFWFSPQILFHLIKLFLLPANLSIDQTTLVKLGKTLLDPYALFCIGFIFLILVASIILLLRKKNCFLLLFIISLIPFSHILVPIYNLASERYLYFPSFIFVFGLSHFIFWSISKEKKVFQSFLLVIVMVSLSCYSIRSFTRLKDWKDSFSLYNASIKTANHPLYKGFRYKGLTPQNKIFVQYPEKEVEQKYLNLSIENLHGAMNILKKEEKKYGKNIPGILKYYGLDPSSLHAKASYLLSQTDSIINNDYKRALNIIETNVKDISLFDSAGLSFYGSLLYYNNMLDKTEIVLKKALEKNPFSLRIIYPLCDLIQIKYGNLNEIERLSLNAFKYYPYDAFTLLVLTKIYKLKSNFEKYAYFSYVYGLRHHSIEALNDAKSTYMLLNKKEKAIKINKRIEAITIALNK